MPNTHDHMLLFAGVVNFGKFPEKRSSFFFKSVSLFIFLIAHIIMTAQNSIDSRSWGDQGNGKYINPVLNADYSDPDVIRVKNKYYMVCSDFHFMGMPVLESEDLVNWKIISQIYQRLDFPEYDQNRRYGGGAWAPAIRYHNGKFLVFFCTPNEGLFMSDAVDPAGPWSPLNHVQQVGGWEDPCPFWDENGQAYLGRSQLGGGPIILHKMSVDGTRLLDEGVKIYEGPVAEGTKIYKMNGWYYVSIPEGGVATGWQTVLRSKDIYGPYESRIVLEQGNSGINGPHQGALVNTPDNDWWFFHFQSADPLGRVVHLQPVWWQEGWPSIGLDTDGNGVGEPVGEWPKPRVRQKAEITAPQTGDEFSSEKKGLQWQINHNPVDSCWSLTRRPGYLVLRALKADKLRNSKNMFTQKTMGYEGEAVTEIDCSSFAEGQRAGLFCIGNSFNAIGMMQTAGSNYIYLETEGQVMEKKEVPVGFSTVWLKVSLDAVSNLHQLYYSFDNILFNSCGEPLVLQSGDWKGMRIGLYSYNTHADGGEAHFNWFRYRIDGPGLQTKQ